MDLNEIIYCPNCGGKNIRSIIEKEKYDLVSEIIGTICLRPIGLLCGFLYMFIGKISLSFSLLFMTIMFLDWFVQYKNIKESTNSRRLVTGLLCGIGIIGLILNTVIIIKINIIL